MYCFGDACSWTYCETSICQILERSYIKLIDLQCDRSEGASKAPSLASTVRFWRSIAAY